MPMPIFGAAVFMPIRIFGTRRFALASSAWCTGAVLWRSIHFFGPQPALAGKKSVQSSAIRAWPRPPLASTAAPL